MFRQTSANKQTLNTSQATEQRVESASMVRKKALNS